MREIIFRVWDKYDKIMVYGDNENYNIELSIDGGFSIEKYEVRKPDPKERWYCKERKDYILMQYTGLKDKNGKEIYEGDIFNMIYKGECVSEKNIVNLADFLGGHYWTTHKGNSDPIYEIIGNIHENPELKI